MDHHNKTILVLGARGLFGHTLYAYLKTHCKQNVMGTSRSHHKNLLVCTEDNLDSIFLSVSPISYVINCTAVLPTTKPKQSEKIFSAINTSLPLTIANMAEAGQFRFFHISTDGVFPPTSGPIDEKVLPTPTDLYGKTKLSGEPNSACALTIRSSIVGFDPIHHHGLLEWIVQSKEKSIHGYTNQLWSGCTSLQLAQYIHWIIQQNRFDEFRSLSPVIHFAPLGPIRKYDLVEALIDLKQTEKAQLIPSKGPPIQRYLISRYTTQMHMKPYKTSMKNALATLIKFENHII
ncbi:MAG: sugar nucleotide-binding protein [Candidatus Gottesmanbacteria bacterium]